MKNLSEIRKIMALVSIKSMEEYHKWHNFFKNLSSANLTVDWIVFVEQINKEINELPPNVFSKRHLNWFDFPKSVKDFDEITSKEYDLTLDLNFENVYLLNYIWVRLNSNLKVGSGSNHDMSEYYDMIINTKDPHRQPKLFVDQVFYFLDKINK